MLDREKTNSNLVENKRLKSASTKLKFMDENFADSVRLTSGWLHDFVCPKCTALMSFNVITKNVSADTKFCCPNCNTEASGQKYYEAWVYQYRRYFAENMDNVIVCALAREDKALQFLNRYIDFYADGYNSFPIHGQHAGKGKIMAQSLDEAVWGIYILKAVYYCRGLLDAQKLEEWYVKLFGPMAEFLIPQVTSYNNISVWLLSCIGMAGLVFDKKDLVDFALDSKFGLYEQLEKGLTKDFLWYEGSLHYHYYMLEGLTYFCELYADCEPKSKMLLMLDKMYQAPMGLTYDTCCILSLNDGWYPLTLKDYAKQIMQAAAICQSKPLLDQVVVIRDKFPDVFDEPATLLYEDKLFNNGRSFFDGHIVMLQKPFPVLLKSGSCVANHMHRDFLSVIIPPFSVDLGSPGYGSLINDSWYRASLSHNTISVDGGQPKKLMKTKITEIAGGIEAIVEEWPGLRNIKRSLTEESNAVKDCLEIQSDTEHLYDWLFHCEGEAEYNLENVAVESLGKGYELFYQVRKVVSEKAFYAVFKDRDGRKLTINIPYVPGIEIYTAMTPGNPADHLRNTLLLRTKGKEVKFTVMYSLDLSEKEKSKERIDLESLQKKVRNLERELHGKKRGKVCRVRSSLWN